MQKVISDLRDFHVACDVPILNEPTIPPLPRKALRRRLIDEEVNKELIPALDADDLEKIADGIADGIYVLVGTALEYGIPLEYVWAEVQRSNMQKVDPKTGKVCRREDGKILKPEGWTPPDIRGVLGLGS